MTHVIREAGKLVNLGENIMNDCGLTEHPIVIRDFVPCSETLVDLIVVS